MRIARVFPTKTSMSPDDRDVYFGEPELFMPEYDEVHISVAFTWDLERAEWLKKQWEFVAPVKVGGPAANGEGDGFVPGMYLKNGITITSRGCPNRCPWCFVNKPLKELEVNPGNNIIDNNLLACSDFHIEKVFKMLRSQHRIKFSGGLEAARITDKTAEGIRSLNLRQLWTAYDHLDNFKVVEKAFGILTKYFRRDQLGCFVLIGFGDDTMDKAEGRLHQILDLGGLPFAMLYRDKAGGFPQPEKAWRKFQKCWVRPAYIRYILKNKGEPFYKEK